MIYYLIRFVFLCFFIVINYDGVGMVVIEILVYFEVSYKDSVYYLYVVIVKCGIICFYLLVCGVKYFDCWCFNLKVLVLYV